MKRVGFMTLGCKTNQYDSQVMMEAFREAGYQIAPFDETCDVYVVNSCVVTGVGEKKSMKFVRQALRKNPSADVVVAGCMAQKEKQALFLPGVRLVIGNQRRAEVAQLLAQAKAENIALCAVEDLSQSAFESMDVQAAEGRARAVMKIQEGCDNRCSYCIIPSVRGPIRSRDMASVKEQAMKLSQAGFLEVVITGIHLSSYGRDLGEGMGLVDAIEAVCQAPGIERVRLGSLEPGYITKETAGRMQAMPKLCPQFHLSLQSGNDHILGRMRRRYSTAQFEEAVRLLREAFPGCAITTDVICGFPGETEEMFEDTMAFSQRIGFSRMHVFPYSEREGTPAAQFEGAIPVAQREARAKRLIALAKEMELAYAKGLVGQEVEVLIEKQNEGFSAQYVRCRVDGDVVPGELVRAKVYGVQGDALLAKKMD